MVLCVRVGVGEGGESGGGGCARDDRRPETAGEGAAASGRAAGDAPPCLVYPQDDTRRPLSAHLLDRAPGRAIVVKPSDGAVDAERGQVEQAALQGVGKRGAERFLVERRGLSARGGDVGLIVVVVLCVRGGVVGVLCERRAVRGREEEGRDDRQRATRTLRHRRRRRRRRWTTTLALSLSLAPFASRPGRA